MAAHKVASNKVSKDSKRHSSKAELRSKSIDFDGILKAFTSKASSANMEALQKSFKETWVNLKLSEQHQAKAKEVYDIRKSELEG